MSQKWKTLADANPGGCRENQPESPCFQVTWAAPTLSVGSLSFGKKCFPEGGGSGPTTTLPTVPEHSRNPDPPFSSHLAGLLCLDLRRLLAWPCVFISGTLWRTSSMADVGQWILQGITDQIQRITMQGKYCQCFPTSMSDSSAGSAGSPSQLYPKSSSWQCPQKLSTLTV